LAKLAPEPLWFARSGTPPTADESRALAERLIIPGLHDEIVIVDRWTDAIRILAQAEHDGRDWDAREEERAALWERAAEQLLESELLERLAQIRERAAEALSSAADRAATRLDIADPRFVAEAKAAGQLALQHAVLAELTAAPTAHPFRALFAVFAAGRWPIAALDGRIHVF
jgi:thioesterase domain-containing protein